MASTEREFGDISAETGRERGSSSFLTALKKLKILSPYFVGPDIFLRFPSLAEEEVQEYEEELCQFLATPEVTESLWKVINLSAEQAMAERIQELTEPVLEREISGFRESDRSLSKAITEKEKDLADRRKDIEEERVFVAGEKVLVAVAKRWPELRPFLKEHGLVAVHPLKGEILPRSLRFQTFELQGIVDDQSSLVKEREEWRKNIQRTLSATAERKKEAEKAVMEIINEWASSDMNQTVMMILNHPEGIEERTLLYLKRATSAPSEGEFLAYIAWVHKNYQDYSNRVDFRAFSRWAALCFGGEAGETMVINFGRTEVEEAAKSFFEYFLEGFRQPEVRNDFSGFLRWSLLSELESLGFPAAAKEPQICFLKEEPKKKITEPQKQVIVPKQERREPPRIMLGSQEKLFTEEELEESLGSILVQHHLIEPKEIPLLMKRIMRQAKRLDQLQYGRHYRELKSASAGAEARIDCDQLRFLVNFADLNEGRALRLVGVRRRDWGYKPDSKTVPL